MRLVLDQGVPRSAAIQLREAGHECSHVGEVGMWAAADREILAWALARGFIVVTLDADFHAMLAVSGACMPSVIRLRIEGLRGERATRIILSVLTEFGPDLERGAIVTVKAYKVTCHRLPLGGP